MNTKNAPSSNPQLLTPRQSAFIRAYSDSESPSFGNAYRSALTAGYSEQFARNITHLNPEWLSEAIGNTLSTIEPEQITQVLTSIVYSSVEPTIVKLRAIELMMKYYGMLQKREELSQAITLNIDLSSALNE